MRRALVVVVGVAAGWAELGQSQARRARPPIIDVHMHAMRADVFGPPGTANCAPALAYLPDGRCHPPNVPAPMTDDEMEARLLAMMQRYNVVGLIDAVIGSPEMIARLQRAAPRRFIRQDTGPLD